ncbi:MAG: hypothetical protein QNJ97_24935 [Myxococcota bacterium]|nr:hypothetical protein [Myxococcota bacterium]
MKKSRIDEVEKLATIIDSEGVRRLLDVIVIAMVIYLVKGC